MKLRKSVEGLGVKPLNASNFDTEVAMSSQYDRVLDPKAGDLDPKTGDFVPRKHDPRVEELVNELLAIKDKMDKEKLIERIGEDTIKNISPIPTGQMSFETLQRLEMLSMARHTITEHNKNRLLQLWNSGMGVEQSEDILRLLRLDRRFHANQIVIIESNIAKLEDYILDKRGSSEAVRGDQGQSTPGSPSEGLHGGDQGPLNQG